MAFNDRLKEARIASGLTQKQLAKELGIAGTTVTGYEKGNSEPNVNTIGKIMDILHVDANFLWQDEMNAHGGFPSQLQYQELEFLKKYRTLDEYGKDVVNTILEKELYRTNQQQSVEYTINPEMSDMVRELPLYYMPVSAGSGNYLDTTDFELIQVADIAYASKADFAVRISGDSMEPRFSTGDIILVQEQSAVEPGELGIFILNGDSLFKVFGGDRLISLNKDYGDRLIGPDDSFYCKGKVLGAVIGV